MCVCGGVVRGIRLRDHRRGGGVAEGGGGAGARCEVCCVLLHFYVFFVCFLRGRGGGEHEPNVTVTAWCSSEDTVGRREDDG